VYYELLMDEAAPDLPAVEAKRALARRITERFHGAEDAEQAEHRFDRLHKQHLPPEEMEDAVVARAAVSGDGLVHVPALLAEHFGLSRSEARRLIGQGGVRLNGRALGDPDLDVDAELLRDAVLQVGRRRFKRLRLEQ
jgi:tyrosyl-tRNA synthetase